jgi:hypothetical protein
MELTNATAVQALMLHPTVKLKIISPKELSLRA